MGRIEEEFKKAFKDYVGKELGKMKIMVERLKHNSFKDIMRKSIGELERELQNDFSYSTAFSIWDKIIRDGELKSLNDKYLLFKKSEEEFKREGVVHVERSYTKEDIARDLGIDCSKVKFKNAIQGIMLYLFPNDTFKNRVDIINGFLREACVRELNDSIAEGSDARRITKLLMAISSLDERPLNDIECCDIYAEFKDVLRVVYEKRDEIKAQVDAIKQAQAEKDKILRKEAEAREVAKGRGDQVLRNLDEFLRAEGSGLYQEPIVPSNAIETEKIKLLCVELEEKFSRKDDLFDEGLPVPLLVGEDDIDGVCVCEKTVLDDSVYASLAEIVGAQNISLLKAVIEEMTISYAANNEDLPQGKDIALINHNIVVSRLLWEGIRNNKELRETIIVYCAVIWLLRNGFEGQLDRWYLKAADTIAAKIYPEKNYDMTMAFYLFSVQRNSCTVQLLTIEEVISVFDEDNDIRKNILKVYSEQMENLFRGGHIDLFALKRVIDRVYPPYKRREYCAAASV